MDALDSFDHLVENLPSWLSKLEDLSVKVSKQHAEFMKLTHSTEVKLTRQKTGSTESLRPQDESKVTVDHKEQSLQVTVTPVPAHDSQRAKANDVLAINEARRKRKPGSAPSAASGPFKYRTRSMLIVYYDSDIQNSFEALVRNIATARNNLRKGKMAATFKARMASLGMGSTSFSAGGGLLMLDPKMARMSKRTNPDTVANKTTSTFDTVDQDLEKAQSLCESAAHQLLREGDCSEEIQTVKQSFQGCLQVARKEAERLREEKAQEPPEEQEVNVDEKEEVVPIDLSPIPVAPSIKPIQFAGIGAIEVDDDSDAESVHIDMSAIRRATRRV